MSMICNFAISSHIEADRQAIRETTKEAVEKVHADVQNAKENLNAASTVPKNG